ncbi:MAG: thioredoxin [Clostridia bacterium]|nr:thioredoxin [Clostridia bacterium]
MAVIKVTGETFENEVVKSTVPVLIDFYADWCGPCKMLRHTVDAIAEERSDIKVVSINVDDESDLAEQFEIFSIPCLVIMKDGKEANRTVGLQSKDSILSLL